MTDPSATSGPLFATRLRLARAALLWEQMWPALWPALLVLGIFLILALFDLLPGLPGRWHAAILLGFGAALMITVARAMCGMAVPDLTAVRRRIERASGLHHRPLQALADRPCVPLDPAATRLWNEHRARLQRAMRHLRVGLPKAGLAARDPWGLRALVALLLVIGAIDAGGDWRDRLLRAVTPGLAAGLPAIAASLDIWVSPPDYTGLPPQFLGAGTVIPVHVPIGSSLLAQVHGGDAVPSLAIDRQRRDFTTVDKENFQISSVLKAGRLVEVRQGGEALGSWPIVIVPDNPPHIAFADPPGSTARAALRIDYKATDDYGVEDVKAVITRPGDKSGERIVLDLPLPGLHLKEAQARSYHDLTPHPWAGLPVEIRLVATDAAGQKGRNPAVRITLPERVFTNPVARAIIEQRKQLTKDPGSRLSVAEILGDLRAERQFYGNDEVVFLGLRVAQESLRADASRQTTAEVEQLLWDTALRIEDGQAPLAERELRRLERELQDALAKGAPDREIDRLIGEMQRAIDRYLQSLAQNMRHHPPNRQQTGPAQMVSRQDLQRMLEQARELARSGDRERARQLLAQLQNMLENLRMAGPGEMQQQGSDEAQQTMNGMRQLMQRQQQLLDRSFRAEQQGEEDSMMQPGMPGGERPDGSAEMGTAAGQQEALRRDLGAMMQRLGQGLGQIPEPLGRAERSMHDATRALRGGQPGAAVGPQSRALEQLQQAARDLAQQMQGRLNGGWGQRRDQRGSSEGDEWGEREMRDPLGRPLSRNGAYDQGDVKIPDWNTLQKSREILDELRRRAGERYRPPLELDYIDRLLKQF